MAKYNAAVVGLGNIGLLYDLMPGRTKPSSHVMAYALHPGIQLAGVVDLDAGRQVALEKLNIKTNFYTNLKDLLDNHQLDIISICTPPSAHIRDLQFILEHAPVKIIFCEKPLSNQLEEVLAFKEFLRTKPDTIIVPNISRRWNHHLSKIGRMISKQEYGELRKIHVRYTRGIYNSGAHMFDLLKVWCGRITQVTTLKKVYTTSELEGEASYTFAFELEKEIIGYAEAFDDRSYYMFEIDLFFSDGKIEIRRSGNDAYYYRLKTHSLFPEYRELGMHKEETDLLHESCLANAVEHMVHMLEESGPPACVLEDAIYPLYVARAIETSYRTGKTERIDYHA